MFDVPVLELNGKVLAKRRVDEAAFKEFVESMTEKQTLKHYPSRKSLWNVNSCLYRVQRCNIITCVHSFVYLYALLQFNIQCTFTLVYML